MVRSMSKGKRSVLINKLGVYIIVLSLVVIGSFVSNKFLSVSNIINILEAVSFLGIVASGMALVTYSGQSVDLSTPSTIAVASFVSVLSLRFGIPIMIILVLISGAVIGMINGLVIGKYHLNTVVWTLSVSFVFSGLTRFIFGSSNIYPEGGNVELFEQISRYRLFNIIPISVVVMISILVILSIIVSYSKYGAKLKLVGCSEMVAEYSGVNIRRMICSAFIMSGVTASIAGLFIGSLSKSAAYTNGTGYDFKAITAIVLSGVTLRGGRGSIAGVLGGVMTIGLMNNIMTLIGINTFIQNVITGIVFIVVVWITNYSTKNLEANNV